MPTVDALLTVYDQRMRGLEPKPPAGVRYERDGPLLRVVGGHRGYIFGQRELGVTGAELDRLIARQRDYFAGRGEAVGWHTRAHDEPADLTARLRAAGFVPEEEQTVLIGLTAELATAPVLPGGVVLGWVTADADMRRIAAMESAVWGSDWSWLGENLIRDGAGGASRSRRCASRTAASGRRSRVWRAWSRRAPQAGTFHPLPCERSRWRHWAGCRVLSPAQLISCPARCGGWGAAGTVVPQQYLVVGAGETDRQMPDQSPGAAVLALNRAAVAGEAPGAVPRDVVEQPAVASPSLVTKPHVLRPGDGRVARRPGGQRQGLVRW